MTRPSSGPAQPDLTLQEADLVEAGLIEAGLSLQNEGLQLLLAEMQALAALIPAAVPASPPTSDAEVEAGFDNMPV